MKIVRLLVLTGISVFLSTASVFAATCTKNAAICSDTQLCADARFYNDGKYNWETRPKYLKHVAEAKRRGLNCSVQGPRAQPDTTALDALREQLSQANEKIAKTKQKLTVANEKEDGLYAKLVTSLLAQIEIGKKFRSEQTQLKNANEKISVLTRALEQQKKSAANLQTEQARLAATKREAFEALIADLQGDAAAQ